MDPTNNEQTELLRAIWTEMKALNGRIDKTNERLDTTNQRLESVEVRLGERIDKTNNRLDSVETHLSTEITALAHAVGDVRDLLRDRFNLRDDVRDLDRRVTLLERRG